MVFRFTFLHNAALIVTLLCISFVYTQENILSQSESYLINQANKLALIEYATSLKNNPIYIAPAYTTSCYNPVEPIYDTADMYKKPRRYNPDMPDHVILNKHNHSYDGEKIAYCAAKDSNIIHIHDIIKNECTHILVGHTNAVGALDWCNNVTIISRAYDYTKHTWYIPSYTFTQVSETILNNDYSAEIITLFYNALLKNMPHLVVDQKDILKKQYPLLYFLFEQAQAKLLYN